MLSQKSIRNTETLIHSLVWILLFAFPFFFIEKTDEGSILINWHFLQHNALLIGVCMLAFYSNYLWLLPKFLFKDKQSTFLWTNAVVVIVLGAFLHYSHKQTPPRNPEDVERAMRMLLDVDWLFFLRDCFTLLITVALSSAIKITMRWHDVEKAREEAEHRRVQAELSNLRNQLNPHFLLNTLNNIYALIAFNTDKAQEAVQELSKLLRYILYENQDKYVPLQKEVEFIHNYISLMRIRLTDNVEVKTNLQIPTNSGLKVAPLLFISLIENAFKHGISPTEKSFIHIYLHQTETKLICEISNSYFPKSSTDKSGSGIGLEQVNKRLNLLYPNKYSWQKQIKSTLEGKIYTSALELDL